MREFLSHLALAAFCVPGFRIDNYTSTRTQRIRSALLPQTYDDNDPYAYAAEVVRRTHETQREQKKPGYVWP